ncbi:methylthioribulose-1-phosphate dehydratase [Leptospira ryugenii]|uniref:Methylthioribulose-1-phosphate dehydratase n=1 Tax=Leptospira ryugenii TaxID=1917863 RepID=A0A2P2E530_9LEPT|nr:methylthioribulose 1-phosphate dehydratase [Leptospira ryugenii]GBF51979.1 methylthioribulose-1-phosphate dehydratase [Leptospira ryugenii]
MGDQESKREIARLAKVYYDRQWMFATAGNLSFRSEDRSSFWITASGKNKSRLDERDFVNVEVSSRQLLFAEEGQRPSAETSIHQVLYKHVEKANSILHVHTLASNILQYGVSKEETYKMVSLPNIEIIKAFNIWEEKPNLQVVVFYNFTNVNQISESIEQFLISHPQYPLPWVLVEEHGPTVWGNSIEETNKHLEAVAFLLDVMKELR